MEKIGEAYELPFSLLSLFSLLAMITPKTGALLGENEVILMRLSFVFSHMKRNRGNVDSVAFT